ncbi:MAG: HlyD family secretion protein [Desulfovibrionaceae bacterium]
MLLTRRTFLYLSVGLILAAAGALGAWLLRPAAGPEAFASGNGRIEATEADVSVKLAGRVIEVLAHEGDWVAKGQVLARMDTKTLEADLRRARAAVAQAREKVKSAQAAVAGREHDIAAAQAAVSQRESELKLSIKDYQRSAELVKQGYISHEKMDQDRTAKQSDEALLRSAQAQLAAARAGLDAAQAAVQEAQAAVDAAQAAADAILTEIDDSTLVAPLDGRVLYRLHEPGEVLAAGTAVLTLLDVTDVYMTLFLPTAQAGRVAIGAEARIVLDAWRKYAVPATVTFVSPEAQFTPKSVETSTEREKLMFRVKVTIPTALLRAYAEQVKTGLPGVAWVRLDPDADWPATLPPLVEVNRQPVP